MFEIMIEESFAAAHALREYEGPCENLHGHTWKVQVFLQGKKLNRLGMIEDFKIIKKELAAVLKHFDHQLLNDVKPFDEINPTCENLAAVIYQKLKKKLRPLHRITVWESTTSYASYS